MNEHQQRLKAWLKIGYDNGFCSEVVCDMHGSIPMTAEEEDGFEEGLDPCIYAVRIWENPPPPR